MQPVRCSNGRMNGSSRIFYKNTMNMYWNRFRTLRREKNGWMLRTLPGPRTAMRPSSPGCGRSQPEDDYAAGRTFAVRRQTSVLYRPSHPLFHDRRRRSAGAEHFPRCIRESSLPEHFSIGIHPKNIDPEYMERDLAIMDRVLAENRSRGVVAVGNADSTSFPWWIPPLRNRSLPLRSSCAEI